MCISGDCYSVQKVREFYPQCNPPNCNNAGYCNSAGNCHCNKGYGGTGCNQRGPGGSVNSGPSSLENYDILKTIRTTTSRTTVQHNVQKNAQGTAAPPNLQYGGGYQKTAQPAGGYGQRSYYEHYYNQLYKYYNQYSGYNAYQNAYTARTMQTLSGQTQGKLNYNQRYGMSSSKLKNRGGGMNWPFNFNQIGPNEITIIAGVCLIAVIFFLMFKTKSKNVPVKEKVYYSEDRGTYDAPDDARYYSTRYEEVYDEPRREDYCGRQRQSAAPAKVSSS
uniref:EGF-like domain-containing protein n=1 Tax=Syphacia muris TaxID=451379 RepID=A0A0N5ACT9_9BILA